MKINFEKGNGLVPVIIQHNETLEILMLGYMNVQAYQKTKIEGLVTFYSRQKERLWTKGESSGNYLTVVEIEVDCDQDTLLIKVHPKGPTCHTGTNSCFELKPTEGVILYDLQAKIADRIDNDIQNSYTNQLYKKGINKVAQK